INIELLGRFSVTIDGATVDNSKWSRRHAAALVKVLALAPGRHLHREQIIDALWPDDDLDRALPKLHKAAHYARRAIDLPDSLVLRGEQVALLPDEQPTVDAVEFDDLGRRAVAADDVTLARQALALYGGELLPQDRYETWAEERREQLRLRHLELLRLDGRWDTVLEMDASDESAHLALMRRHAANGDRHAALRQFERMDRSLRRELGVAPGRQATALRDRLIADHEVAPRRDDSLVGRDSEIEIIEAALLDSAAGRSRTIIVLGDAGMGKSSLLAAITSRAQQLNFRVGHGTSAPVEGAWPYAPVVEALADLCRRHPALLDGLPDHHRLEIDRALAGAEVAWTGDSSHQRLFVAAAELVRLASATTGLLLTVDDVHDADDASLRLLHYIARATREHRVCIVIAHRHSPISETLADTRHSLIERHGAIELQLRALSDEQVVALIARHVADPPAELVDQIVTLGRGVPFAVNELARRAANEPTWVRSLDANTIGGNDAATREVLQRVAVVGSSFDTDEFVALSALPEDSAFDLLDIALAASIIEPTSNGYRFRHALVREALLDDVPPHRRPRIHRDAALRLIELQASPARIGHHLLAAGASAEAVPYLLRAAETAAAVGAYRDALALVDSIRPHAVGAERTTALSLRGDLLNAIGDPMATSAYREALACADAGSVRRLRARLARSAVMSGDLETAAAVLDGLETDGGRDDAEILLTRGHYAFFASDLEGARAASEAAQKLVLAGETNWRVLDLVGLQGLLAHLSGNWYDRIQLELRRTRENPAVANAIFDGHLCAAEYVLYGSTPYAEVIAVARDLQSTARRSGALRAAAFASALIGEAALLSGDLQVAATELIEGSELHRDVGSPAGEAHCLQRLAEVRVEQGELAEAKRLLQQALPLARRSMVAKHLLQRIFGTMILATSDPDEARAIVDRAESTLGWDDHCVFCSIMLSVPAAIACARAGDLDNALRHLRVAETSGVLWQGTSWEGALAEAQAVVAQSGNDGITARLRMQTAADVFERAGQPLDAERCRRALALV
ncbi:MAG: transcriptional regulator, family, partial [Ilumatobacteraceae bacterium]|nr:transcriptional regulator, family [Ilumatobacteraceae bacterium]